MFSVDRRRSFLEMAEYFERPYYHQRVLPGFCILKPLGSIANASEDVVHLGKRWLKIACMAFDQ